MSVPSYADTGAFTINFWMRRFGSFDGTTSGIGVQYLFSHVSADIATDFTGDGGQQNITRPNQVCSTVFFLVHRSCFCVPKDGLSSAFAVVEPVVDPGRRLIVETSLLH